jgi:preprotein translocase SecE subunit
MAVAVKNSPDVSAPGALDRQPVVSLAGAAYVLGSLGVVFGLLPYVWNDVLGVGTSSFGRASLLGVLMVAAALGLAVLGTRLLGPRPVPGAKAGIFVSLVGALVVLLLTRWAGYLFEHWAYDLNLFGGSGPTVGAALTVAFGLVLLALGVRLLFRPGVEKWLVRFEGQGWFSLHAYKPLQGQRVRRGTILGMLLIAGAGIYTLISHGILRRGAADWQVYVPFTGQVVVGDPGDAKGDSALAPRMDRYAFRELFARYDPATHVKVRSAGSSEKLKVNEIVPKSEFDAEKARIAGEAAGVEPQSTPVQPPAGETVYRSITVLPAVQFTVPLLILAGSIWLAWRIVNLPVFADFLIATEAEINKVSWTTRRRLVQDTIVVLTTVVLMALFLFGTDQVWRVLLSMKPIQVLQIPKQQQKNVDRDRPLW